MQFKALLLIPLLLANTGLNTANNNGKIKIRYKETLAKSAAQINNDGKVTSNGSWIPDKVEEMPGMKLGPFVRLANGSILTIDKTKSYVSKDEGKTWSEEEIFAEPDKYEIRPERALIRTRSGVIILAFANDKERANWNWQKEISDSPGAILPTYAVRSTDDGKTWESPKSFTMTGPERFAI